MAGDNPLTFTVPCTAVAGATYARFRLSSAGGLGPTGEAADGEVEDYAVNVGAVDFGDAPDTYGTTARQRRSQPPRRGRLLPRRHGGQRERGQPSVGATGDGADEDGVALPAGALVACSTVNIPVNLTNTAGIATPRLDAWIDFDGDGVFNDPRDRIATSLALVSGANTVTVNVPCDAQSVDTYARFRLSSAGSPAPAARRRTARSRTTPSTVKGLDFGDAARSHLSHPPGLERRPPRRAAGGQPDPRHDRGHRAGRPAERRPSPATTAPAPTTRTA